MTVTELKYDNLNNTNYC